MNSPDLPPRHRELDDWLNPQMIVQEKRPQPRQLRGRGQFPRSHSAGRTLLTDAIGLKVATVRKMNVGHRCTRRDAVRRTAAVVVRRKLNLPLVEEVLHRVDAVAERPGQIDPGLVRRVIDDLLLAREARRSPSAGPRVRTVFVVQSSDLTRRRPRREQRHGSSGSCDRASESCTHSPAFPVFGRDTVRFDSASLVRFSAYERGQTASIIRPAHQCSPVTSSGRRSAIIR